MANFGYAPNREGLDFLLEEVMPLVWAAQPRLRLNVAGRGYEAQPGVDERVEVLGFVEDLEPLYTQAACALVPLLSGAGSPVKFIEALAHGLPVVATPRAAAGIDAESGRHYLEGDGRRGLRRRAARSAGAGARRGGRRRGACAGRERALDRGPGSPACRMRIVSVMTSGTRGGAEYAAVRLLDALAARGHEAVLLTSHPDTAEGTRVAARHVDLGPKLGVAHLAAAGAPAGRCCCRRLRRELEREAPFDVLLLHFKKEQLLAPRLPAELRPRVAWAEWGPVPPPLRGGLPGRLYRRAARERRRRCWRSRRAPASR